MLLRRSALEELGGYDPYAIAEDAELTLRITQKRLSLTNRPRISYLGTRTRAFENPY